MISKAWVLTGAHCMVDVPMDNMLVLLGAHSLNDGDNEKRYVEVVKKVVHPDYSQPTVLNNDIGLVKMKVDLNAFTKFISPACMPPIGDTGSISLSSYKHTITCIWLQLCSLPFL